MDDPTRNKGHGATTEIAEICETDFPFAAIPPGRSAGIAVITGIEGASYRPRGAAIVIDGNGHSVGNLSSGCLERDVIEHAREAFWPADKAAA